MKRVAVLISGRGSNLGALIAAQDASYRIVLVISNVADAGGLEKARAAGISTIVIPHSGKSREAFDAEMDVTLRAANGCTASRIAAMCSGVVPQQPPTMFTRPSAANSRNSRDVTSGVSSKPVSAIGLGSPAFG